MKAAQVVIVPKGVSLEETQLPFHTLQLEVDVETMRKLAEADGGSDDFAEINQLGGKFACDGLWTEWTISDGTPISSVIDRQQLVVVVSGAVQIPGAGAAQIFGPGDVIVAPLTAGQTAELARSENCRTIHLLIASDLLEQLGAAPKVHIDRTRPAENPLIKRMITGPDQRSYFTGFDNFFPDSTGKPSPIYSTEGFWFAYFSDACFVDLHPEIVKNLVLPLSGSLQLGTAGDGQLHEFFPGDVCLADDSVGEGHTDRTDAPCGLLIVEMRADGLWPMQEGST
uniref:Uncharacterized protein n=1 Tax=Sphingomonas sp. JE1 TaxID=1628059 RepID=A0A0D5A019_9SPHN|nr:MULTISPECIES: hypothetical protein [unclassified Sphingomonas]AJW29605.1 hypothetical protein pJE1_183 [Sphingomonas sp. JE1]